MESKTDEIPMFPPHIAKMYEKPKRLTDEELTKQEKSHDELKHKLHSKNKVMNMIQATFNTNESFRDVKSTAVRRIMHEQLNVSGNVKNYEDIQPELVDEIPKVNKLVRQMIGLSAEDLKKRWNNVKKIVSKDEWKYDFIQTLADSYRTDLFTFFFKIPNEFFGDVKTEIIAFMCAVEIKSKELEIRNAIKFDENNGRFQQQRASSYTNYYAPRYQPPRPHHYGQQRSQYHQHNQNQQSQQRNQQYNYQYTTNQQPQYQFKSKRRTEPKRSSFSSESAYRFAHQKWKEQERIAQQQKAKQKQQEKIDRENMRREQQYKQQQRQYAQSRTQGHRQTGYVNLETTYNFLMRLNARDRKDALRQMSLSDPQRRNLLQNYYNI